MTVCHILDATTAQNASCKCKTIDIGFHECKLINYKQREKQKGIMINYHNDEGFIVSTVLFEKQRKHWVHTKTSNIQLFYQSQQTTDQMLRKRKKLQTYNSLTNHSKLPNAKKICHECKFQTEKNKRVLIYHHNGEGFIVNAVLFENSPQHRKHIRVHANRYCTSKQATV